jgi:hypothetical protein
MSVSFDNNWERLCNESFHFNVLAQNIRNMYLNASSACSRLHDYPLENEFIEEWVLGAEANGKNVRTACA